MKNMYEQRSLWLSVIWLINNHIFAIAHDVRLYTSTYTHTLTEELVVILRESGFRGGFNQAESQFRGERGGLDDVSLTLHKGSPCSEILDEVRDWRVEVRNHFFLIYLPESKKTFETESAWGFGWNNQNSSFEVKRSNYSFLLPTTNPAKPVIPFFNPAT